MKLDIQKLDASPKALDAQSPIVIDKWVDIESEECKTKDPDHAISKKLLADSTTNGFIKIDSQGRLWVLGIKEELFPYHFENGNKLYGMRIAAAAAN